MPLGTADGPPEDEGQPSDYSDSIFARRLREVRQQAGITQQQLADWMTQVGHKLHRSAVAKIELGERPVTIGEAVQLAGILGVPLMELVTDRLAETKMERQHADRIAAQIAVRSLIHEAAEADKLLREQTLIYEDVLSRLREARLRLRELGGEVPWDTPGVPPGLQPEIFDPVRQQILQMGEETRSRVFGQPKFGQTK